MTFFAYPAVALAGFFAAGPFDDAIAGLLLTVPVAHFAFGLAVERWWAVMLPLGFFLGWLGIVGCPGEREGEQIACILFPAIGAVGAISLAAGVTLRKMIRS